MKPYQIVNYRSTTINESMRNVTIPLHVVIIIVHHTIGRWIIYNIILLTLPNCNPLLMNSSPVIIGAPLKVGMMKSGICITNLWNSLS